VYNDSTGRATSPPCTVPDHTKMEEQQRPHLTPVGDIAKAALEYAAKGWPVLPVHSRAPNGTCTCLSPDCKEPAKHALTPNAENDATTDPEIIAGWWQRWPWANVGVVTGARSGIVVFHVDDKPDALEAYDRLLDEVGLLPITLTGLSGGDGFQMVFRYPGVCTKSKANAFGPGLDVKADGAWVVVAPSVHITGQVYRWEDDPPPLALWPEVLTERLNARPAPAADVAESLGVSAEDPDDWAQRKPPGDSAPDAGSSKQSATPGRRTVKLTRASDITVRPVRWLWKDRVPLGSLCLLGGREGIGKSTVAYTLAADITHGRLPGVYYGQPRSVIVAATEDSWEHTIVPRLMAAGADLARVYRADVSTAEGVDTGLSLPRDLDALGRTITEVDAALVLLDPLLSRLDAALDTHKDAEVRLALEPLTALADRVGVAVVGLIHVNKSTSTDPLTALMASRAFAAVARAVLFMMTDPDDESILLLGQPKNNLGRTDLPTLTFRIEGAHVADTDEGPVWTSRVRRIGQRAQSIREVLESVGATAEARSATGEAAGWLEGHLTNQGGTDESASVKEAGRKAGHSRDALYRALKGLKGTTESRGFPRHTYWSLPGGTVQSSQPSRRKSGESATTTTTASTATTDGPVSPVDAVSAVDAAPRARDDWTKPIGLAPGADLATCAVCGHEVLTGRDVCEPCHMAVRQGPVRPAAGLLDGMGEPA